jgi:hypothetical protein
VTSPGGTVAGVIVTANSVILTCTIVADSSEDELEVDEPPLLLFIATTATTPNTSAAIETATNMRPTTDLAKNDSLLSTVEPDEASDIVLAFLAWS